jgi:hypothetical protein
MAGRPTIAPGSGAAFALVSALAVASASGCSDASGTTKGGELRPGYDASAPPPLDVPVTEPTFADAEPTTWRGIYRDYFGRRSEASCAGNGQCHDSADRLGAKRSQFVCGDVDGCYKSLRTSIDLDPRISTRPLVADADIPNPSGAYLFKVISYREPDGTLQANRLMPQIPADYAFMPVAINRMQAWIAAGAKNN